MNFFIVAIKVQKTSVYTNGGEEQMSIAPGPESRKQFGNLIEKYERGVLHLCCIYLRDMHMAEDAVQETFLKAYKSLSAFRGESSEKTWLYRIAINVCIDMRRSRWYRFIDQRVDMDKLSIPTNGVSVVSIALMQEILRLPARYREVVFLFYYEDMKLAEIAQLLRISVSTVNDRLRKARELLRKALEGGMADGE